VRFDHELAITPRQRRGPGGGGASGIIIIVIDNKSHIFMGLTCVAQIGFFRFVSSSRY